MDRSDQLRKLSEAVDAYLGHCSGSGESDEEFLARHEHLRELLEPMLSERDDAADPEGGAGESRFLGDYELIREVGRGGMGVVYEAVQVSLGRRVALKVLPAHLTLSPRQIERFRREASAAAKLRHPGIVPVHAVGEADGAHFYAMEFVEGSSLHDRLAQGHDAELGVLAGASRPAEAAEIAAQVAEALAYAHEHGVVHRDVKPHNILIDTSGRARLVDFGLAKDLDSASLSQSGQFAGTVFYASPEQAAGKRDQIDGRSDVFSLGVVLYEMLAGERPFGGDTTQEVLLAVSHRDAPALRQRDARVPRDLEIVCAKALEKNPAGRYASAAEFAEDLRRFLHHEPIEARPPGAGTRVRKLIRRHRALFASSALVLLVVLVSAVVLWLQGADQARRDREALERSRRAVQELTDLALKSVLPRRPGHAEQYRALLERALEMCEDILAREGDATPARFQRQFVSLLLKAGKFYLHRGEHELSVTTFRRALELGERLYDAAEPGRLRATLAVHAGAAQNNLLVALGDVDRRRVSVHFDRVIERLEAVTAEPGVDELPKSARTVLAMAYSNRGYHQMDDPRFAKRAVEDLATGVRYWRELGVEGQRTREGGSGFAWALVNLAIGKMNAGAVPEAEPLIAEAVTHLRALLEDDPNDAYLRTTLATVLEHRSRWHAWMGQHAQADADGKAVIELREVLARDFPGNVLHKRRLVEIKLILAGRLADRKRDRAAERLLEQCRGLLAGDHWADRILRAAIDGLVAHLMSKKPGADPAEVDARFRSACDELTAIDGSLDLQIVRVRLSGALSNYAFWKLGRGEVETATELVTRALATLRDGLRVAPANPALREFVPKQIGVLVRCLERQGRYAEIFRAAGELVELDPTAVNHARAAWNACTAITIASRSAELDGVKRAELVEQYGARAVQWLRIAVDNDFPATRAIPTTVALQPLHGRPDFQTLVAEINGSR